MNKKYLRTLLYLISFIITIFIFLFIIYGIKENIFNSNDNLISFVESFGIIGPLLFIFIQIIQVIFPIIPGGASCLAGVFAFGGFYGFIYNYIGLCIGSICNYFIAKYFGTRAICFLFREETINRYLSHIKSNKFNKVFLWGIVLPGAPDDLLCYVAGISNISILEFIIIILLGKPLTLIFYSLFADYFPFFS